MCISQKYASLMYSTLRNLFIYLPLTPTFFLGGGGALDRIFTFVELSVSKILIIVVACNTLGTPQFHLLISFCDYFVKMFTLNIEMFQI